MNGQLRNPATDDAAAPGKGGFASRPMGLRQAFREIRKGVAVMWWAFLDWVTVGKANPMPPDVWSGGEAVMLCSH